MSQIIKSYKKFLISNFFHVPVWILRIIFPQIRTKIREFKIDFQSYAFIKLNPKSTLHRIEEKDLPKIRKVIERNKINSRLSIKSKNIVEGKIIEGKITKITDKFVLLFVDGLKSEPIVDINELKALGLEKKINIGEKIQVFLEKIEDKNGNIVVSAQKAQKIKGRIQEEN